MLDRRKSARRRTMLEGRIEVEKLNGWSVTCGVRNLGDDGACVTIPKHVVVPPTFTIDISGRPRAARLVWYGSGRAGVEFTKAA